MLKLVRSAGTDKALDVQEGAGEDRALVAAGPAGTVALRPDAGGVAVRGLAEVQRERDEELPAKRRSWLSVRNMFFVFVIAPTLAAAVYMYGYASDQYRAEAQFVIKSAQKSTASGLSAILESTGLATSTGDTHAVISFLLSRDGLERLVSEVPFKAMMEREDADFLARYPGYAMEDNFEALYDHYLRKVEVVLDATTGITEMSVLAFTPKDADAIAESMLVIGEEFVERLNAKSYEDSLRLAQESVERAEARSREAQQELTQFRTSNRIVDPQLDVKRLSGISEELTAQLVELDGRIAALEESAPRSPQLRILRQNRANVASLIDANTTELSGDGILETGALPGVIADYTGLQLEAEFAAKALAAANLSYETARNDVLRKQLYLTRIVEPRIIDDSRDPKRMQIVLVVFALVSSAFLLLWLFGANIKEHAE